MWLIGRAGAMNGGRLCTLKNSTAAARSFAVVTTILAVLCSSANAAQPPADHCRVASKIEYDSRQKTISATQQIWRLYQNRIAMASALLVLQALSGHPKPSNPAIPPCRSKVKSERNCCD